MTWGYAAGQAGCCEKKVTAPLHFKEKIGGLIAFRGTQFFLRAFRYSVVAICAAVT